MSEENTQKSTQALAKAAETQMTKAGISLTSILEKLPSWALVPVIVALFALLMTDVAVADPLPFVDEAALLWALVSGMKVLGGRRKKGREQTPGEDLEPDVVADVMPEPVR